MLKTEATVNANSLLFICHNMNLTYLSQLNHNPEDLVDIDSEPEKNSSKGGRPRTVLLHDVTIPCKAISTGKSRHRCAMAGCLQSWGGKPQAARIYNHLLTECRGIDAATKAKVSKATSDRTLHAQLEDTIEESGGLEKLSKTEGKKARKLQVNQAVLDLICGAGVPPTIVDTKEWRRLIDVLDSTADVYSSSSFSDTYIPAEAHRITEDVIQKLSKMKNLTISYDGGTTKAVESIYTIHVTAPGSRQAYLIEGSEKSGVSHTGAHIAELLLKVGCQRPEMLGLNLKII